MSCSRASFVSLAGPIVHTIFVRRASMRPECHKPAEIVLNTHPMFGRNAEGNATLGGTPLSTLLESARCGTPSYLYDLDGVRAAARALAEALADVPSLI